MDGWSLVFPRKPMHPEVIDLCSCSDQDSLADETKPSPSKKRSSDEQEGEAADSTLEGRRRRRRHNDAAADQDQDDEPTTTPSSSSSLVVVAVELEAEAETAESRTSAKDESSQLPLLLFLKSEDDAVLTTINRGVLVASSAVAAASTSASTKNKTLKSNKTKTQPPKNRNKVHLIATPNLVHIGQPDRWSCGFRNWQMLLSFVVPLLPPDHSYYRHGTAIDSAVSATMTTTATTTTTTRYYEIPSVRDLQSDMEQCWAEGFDPDGARHYGGTIVGRRSWIGALEVSACLSYLGIDNTVVQFIRCCQSRQELEPFCVQYFSSSDEESSPSSLSSLTTEPESSRTRATALLQRSGSSPTDTRGNNSSNINNHRGHLPLYLQWEGHSVTAIGVERATTGDGATTHLLVLNPSRSGVAIETAVRRHNLVPLRLPFAQLRSKDTQVLLPSTYSLSVWERERLRGPAQVLTAAMDHVERAMARASSSSNSSR